MNSNPHPFARALRGTIPVILERWQDEVRRYPESQSLSALALRNHIPHLLEEIARSFERGPAGARVGPHGAPVDHAIERLLQGFDLEDVVHEYAALRRVLIEVIEAVEGGTLGKDLGRANAAIDVAIGEAVSAYVGASAKTARALDKLSVAALESSDLMGVLRGLISVLLETTRAVDTAAVLLREGDRLVVRAAVGLDEELASRFSVAIGEGFAGTIAARAEPLVLAEGSRSPIIKSEHLRARGLRTIYGCPLMHRGEVIGVVHMGSTHAASFSEQDRKLLAMLAARVTTAIEQAKLRDDLERAHREVADALEREREARLAAERAAGARDRVLAIVAHDLRNPLNNVRMALQLLRQECAGDAHSRRIETAQRAVVRMQLLIGDLMDVTNIEARRLSIVRRPAPVGPILAEAIEMNELAARDAGIEISWSSEVPLDLELELDRERVLQALGNVIGNALKFSPAGSPVRVVARRTGEDLAIDVVDRGPGIAGEDLPRVFEPFWSKLTVTHGGAGIGLAITRGIVEAHGGHVDVASRLGEGTTFTLSFPISDVPTRAEAPSPAIRDA